MKNASVTLLSVACALALAGCSSSRGGDEVNTSRYLTEKPTQTKPSTSTDSTTSDTTATGTTSVDNQPTTNTSTTNTGNAGNTTSGSTSTTNTSTGAATTGTASTSPFQTKLFTPSAEGDLAGAVITLNSNGTTTSRNPINNGKELLNELIIGDSHLVLFNANDLLNGNGMDGFKTLSNRDASKETPISETVSGYAGGWGSEASYNPSEFRNVRFGVANVGSQSHLFVQGYLTPTANVQTIRGTEFYPVPKSGKFLYEKGYALYGNNGRYQQLAAEVEANFSDKKIDVKLTDNGTEKLAFNGVIDGNTFSGKSNGIESQGAFYGSQASEVGGVFYQTEGTDKGKNGVFGAVDKRFIQ